VGFYPNVTSLHSGICRRNSVSLSVVCLSVCETFVHPTQPVEIFIHFVPWPSADLLAKFYGDRPRETPSGVKRKRGNHILQSWTCRRLYLGNSARYGFGYNYWQIGNHTRRIRWYLSGFSRVTPSKGSGPQFGKTVYISEINGARKVKSKAQVAMNKNSNPVQKLFS